MANDIDLLRHFSQTRSDRVFAELVQRHVDLVFAVAMRQVGGDAHLARDVAQTVFSALARKAGQLSQRTTLTGWLYRSTCFAASNLIRTESQRRKREQEFHAMHEIIHDSGSQVEWERVRPLLDDAISELNDKDRDAVCMRFFENLAFSEIGSRIRQTENAARMRVDRALDKLNAALARRGITSSTAALAVGLSGQAGAQAPSGFAATLVTSALVGPALTGGSIFVTFMHSTKLIAGLAAAFTTAAVATAVYQFHKHNSVRAELAAVTQERDELLTRVAATERDPAQLLPRIEKDTIHNPAPTAPSASSGSVAPTHEMVEARFKHAQQLERDGRLQEALEEYLWCYDVGMPAIPALAGVRGTIPRVLGKIGERLPATVDAMRARRDAAQERFLTSTRDFIAAMDVTKLNQALGEPESTLEMYDRMQPTDRRRDLLGRLLFDQFVQAQRYEEASRARSYNQMSSRFEMFANRPVDVDDPANAETRAATQRSSVIRQAGTEIEVLIAVGDLEHAADLTLRVLALDDSSETTELLEMHARRAGRPQFIATVRSM